MAVLAPVQQGSTLTFWGTCPFDKYINVSLVHAQKSLVLATGYRLIIFLLFLEPFKEIFSELYCLCVMAVLLPVSSAGCERSFSTLKLFFNHLRSTMEEERLSNLALLSIESKCAKALDLDTFVQHFSQLHNSNRQIILVWECWTVRI